MVSGLQKTQVELLLGLGLNGGGGEWRQEGCGVGDVASIEPPFEWNPEK